VILGTSFHFTMNEKHVKTKEPCVARTYDDDGFRKRAACVCVNADETEVLLVSSRKDAEQWIVPGGGVEAEEEAEEAALREVREEAGVAGVISRCLGLFENVPSNHRTSVFVMEVTEEFEEWEEMLTLGRKRRWFPLEEAVEVLHKPHQSNYLKLLLPHDHRHSLTATGGSEQCLRGAHGRRVLVPRSSASEHASCNTCSTDTNVIISNFIVTQSKEVDETSSVGVSPAE